MKYFLELWLKDQAKDTIRAMSTLDPETFHPHITLVRPFYLQGTPNQIQEQELDVANTIARIGKKIGPFEFTLEGKMDFDKEVYGIPIIHNFKLKQLDKLLESELEKKVSFDKKLNDKKIFHATVDFNTEIEEFPRLDQYALRITALKKEEGEKHYHIAFSYDLVRNEIQDREKSLSLSLWRSTQLLFESQYQKKITLGN